MNPPDTIHLVYAKWWPWHSSAWWGSQLPHVRQYGSRMQKQVFSSVHGKSYITPQTKGFSPCEFEKSSFTFWNRPALGVDKPPNSKLRQTLFPENCDGEDHRGVEPSRFAVLDWPWVWDTLPKSRFSACMEESFLWCPESELRRWSFGWLNSKPLLSVHA